MDADVIVVGAGMAGLSCAAALARTDRRILVLDKQAVPPDIHKGELLQPGSLPALSRWGATPLLQRSGGLAIDRLVCRTGVGDEIGALDYRLLPHGHTQALVHDHAVIQESVRDALPAAVEVLRSAAVSGLLHDGDRVTGVTVRHGGGESRVSAPVVVGADGPSSVVRRAAGITVERHRYEHDLIGLDAHLGSDLPSDPHEAHAHLTEDGLRLLLPMPHNRVRLYAQLPNGAFRSIGRARLPAWIQSLSSTTPALEPFLDAFVAGSDTARAMSAVRYVASMCHRPGLVLVGDAAHSMHPMAGQGMNAAIRDADLLGSLLAEVDLSDPPSVDRSLDRYAAERMPTVHYVARLSHNLARLFTDRSWVARRLGHRMLRKNSDNVRLCSVLTYNVSGLGVRRYTLRDRLIQFGLVRDPARHEPEPGLYGDL